jgi:antitoxin component of MazEF toxin-antitoxin module
MKRKVVTIGSSAGITISPAELAALGIRPGSHVEVTLAGQSLEVRPVSPYSAMTLDELIPIIEQRAEP